VKQLLEEARPLCPAGQESQLVCGSKLEYCLARNIRLDFRSLVPRLNTESLR
jgi:hypothetical protein